MAGILSLIFSLTCPTTCPMLSGSRPLSEKASSIQRFGTSSRMEKTTKVTNPLVNSQLDPEHHQFWVVSLIFQILSGRVYVIYWRVSKKIQGGAALHLFDESWASPGGYLGSPPKTFPGGVPCFDRTHNGDFKASNMRKNIRISPRTWWKDVDLWWVGEEFTRWKGLW